MARGCRLAYAGAIVATLLAASPAAAQSADGGYRVVRPDGAGPHPAILFVSGCSGFRPSFAPGVYDRFAEQLRGQGYVVAFVDYLGRRGLSTCARAPITHAEAGRDVVAAAAWLGSRPEVDRARIAVLGWSYGGGAVIAALGEHEEARLGFSRAVLYYPVCQPLRPWKVRTPVLMLIGASDEVAPAAPCQALARKSAAPEATRVILYPDAYHGFDVSELPPKMAGPWGVYGHHPQAAAAAWEELLRFFAAK